MIFIMHVLSSPGQWNDFNYIEAMKTLHAVISLIYLRTVRAYL